MEERTVFQPSPFGSVRPGTRLHGTYEIEKLIALGGMGEVYRGFNVHTHDVVAIKMIRPEFSDNEEMLALFRREAQILSNLVHEAIVRYFLFSVDPGIRRAYLAMEFVDGPSLTDQLKSGALSAPEVTILRRRLASALETAHLLGVVHRDISPDNIILPNADVRNAKIIDFGIARAVQVSQQTIIGSGFAGKYNYVSPEQLGLAGGDVTFKSDIYSLGLVLAEAARGRAIDMSGSQAQVIEKRRAVPDLTDIDPNLRPLLDAMLQPLPQGRPASMAAVVEWTEPSSGRWAAIVGVAIAVASLGSVAFFFKDDFARWRSEAPGPAVAPSAAWPPRAEVSSKPAKETGDTGSQTATLPPLSAPQEPSPTSPAPAQPGEPPPSVEGRESSPHTEVARPGAPPASVANPTSPHVLTSDELLEGLRPKPSLATVDLPSATVGTAYWVELPRFSGKDLRLSAESMPDGLAFRDLGDGRSAIGGAPTRPGGSTMRVEALNRAGSAQMTASLFVANAPVSGAAEKPAGPPPGSQRASGGGEPVVRPEPPRPSLPVTTLDPAIAGRDYYADLPAFAGGAMALRAEPAPPAGLAFADLGSGRSRISGKPATVGSYAFDVAATSAAGLAGRMTVKFTVDPPGPLAKAEPRPAAQEAPAAEDRASAFVQSFDGGDCFLIKALPGAGRGYAYLGVGDKLEPFMTFETSFQKEVGAEPKLVLRKITPAECSAVDVLRLAGNGAARAPRVALNDYRVGRNMPLSGTVSNLDGRRLYLLLVDNEGKAYGLEAKPQPGGSAAAFSVPLVPDDGSVGPIQIVLAVTSASPIPALETFRSGELKALARAITQEVKAGTASIGADFFMFVN